MLKPREQQVAILHAQGLSNVEIAKRLKLTRQTVAAWLRKPEFIEAVEQARKVHAEAIEVTIAEESVKNYKLLTLPKIEQGALQAYEFLIETLSNSEERSSVRLQAAQIIFSLPSRLYNVNSAIALLLSYGYKVTDPTHLSEDDIVNFEEE